LWLSFFIYLRMMVLFRITAFALLLFSSLLCFSAEDSVRVKKQDYQIFLKQPAKSIRLLMYEKDFTPIQGELSEDRKSIIIKNYRSGSRVHVKVEYEDGTLDEFVKSPCFIDPVIACLPDVRSTKT
jgi:hypothetical protein